MILKRIIFYVVIYEYKVTITHTDFLTTYYEDEGNIVLSNDTMLIGNNIYNILITLIKVLQLLYKNNIPPTAN